MHKALPTPSSCPVPLLRHKARWLGSELVLRLPKLWPASATLPLGRLWLARRWLRPGHTRLAFVTGQGALRRVAELVPSTPLSPQGRQRNSELLLQEQLQAQLHANQEQLRVQVPPTLHRPPPPPPPPTGSRPPPAARWRRCKPTRT
jgi:hypothetical protein